MRFLFITYVLICFLPICNGQSKVFKTNNGKISFVSTAPKEIIKAQSNTLMGVLDPASRNFSFRILMKNFNGFNNPLQKEHFYENYMETDEYPEATFKGKIIEPILEGKKQTIRAKGILTIHGVANEILIDVEVNPIKDGMEFNSKFDLSLEDFNINVPRIVNQKISKTIAVSVEGLLKVEE
jgi:YceI-like domain